MVKAREKLLNAPFAPTSNTVGHCPDVIQIIRMPLDWNLPNTIARPL